MVTDINLISRHFLLNYRYQKLFYIFLIILILGLNLYVYYYINKPLNSRYNQLLDIDKIILSEEEIFEIDWLNKNLVTFNINGYYNIFEDLLGDIAWVDSIFFINGKWEIRGELKGIEKYQVLHERINELRMLNYNINLNRVGSLQNSSFLMQFQTGDAR